MCIKQPFSFSSLTFSKWFLYFFVCLFFDWRAHSTPPIYSIYDLRPFNNPLVFGSHLLFGGRKINKIHSRYALCLCESFGLKIWTYAAGWGHSFRVHACDHVPSDQHKVSLSLPLLSSWLIDIYRDDGASSTVVESQITESSCLCGPLRFSYQPRAGLYYSDVTMRNLRHRTGRRFVWGHTANTWWSQNWGPALFLPHSPCPLPHCPLKVTRQCTMSCWHLISHSYGHLSLWRLRKKIR